MSPAAPSRPGPPPDPFDRAALARNRARAERIATRNGGGAEFLLVHATNDLAERLDGVERHFDRAVVIDPPLSLVGDRIERSERVGQVETVHVEADGRVPIAPNSCDLVVSSMAIHLYSDVPGFLAQVARALRPDGLFLAAFPGGETLRELREVWLQAEAEITGGASPRVHPFIDVRDAGALLQRAGLALPVADVDRLTVRYNDALALMHDLRAMGMANAMGERSRHFTPREVLMRAAALYGERHADSDGRIRATHDIVSLSGWRPHESQQKPLKPGSAKASLAAALGDRSKGDV